MRILWIAGERLSDTFKTAGTGPSRPPRFRRPTTASRHWFTNCATLFLCAYSITAMAINAAVAVVATSAERRENWRRKRIAAMPARAKRRAGYQRGK